MVREEIKATIIILTYNQAATIGRALESVIGQRCSYPFEILIADDGSSDGTREICERYANSNPDLIRILPAAPNKGLVDNYFDAFEASRGEYIGDCAGDDEWLSEDRLQRQIDLLDSDPSLSVVYTDVEIFDGKKRILKSLHPDWEQRSKTRISGEEIILSALNNLRSLPFVLSSALYRKSSVMQTYLQHPEMVRMPETGVEDLPLLCAIGAAGDGQFLNIPGYRYFIGSPSVSNNLTYLKEYQFYARLLSGVARLARFYNISLRKLRRHFNDKISHISAQARHVGDCRLIDDVSERQREWGLRLPLRARLHLLLLRLFGKNTNNI